MAPSSLWLVLLRIQLCPQKQKKMQDNRENQSIFQEITLDCVNIESVQTEAVNKELDVPEPTITEHGNETLAPTLTASPQQMDPQLQEQGRDLHEVLQLFKATTTAPLSSFVLDTPNYKTKSTLDEGDVELLNSKKPRQSPRLKKKTTKGKSIIKSAQELVAKKCGILQEEEALENLTLQQYLDMYKQP